MGPRGPLPTKKAGPFGPAVVVGAEGLEPTTSGLKVPAPFRVTLWLVWTYVTDEVRQGPAWGPLPRGLEFACTLCALRSRSVSGQPPTGLCNVSRMRYSRTVRFVSMLVLALCLLCDVRVELRDDGGARERVRELVDSILYSGPTGITMRHSEPKASTCIGLRPTDSRLQPLTDPYGLLGSARGYPYSAPHFTPSVARTSVVAKFRSGGGAIPHPE